MNYETKTVSFGDKKIGEGHPCFIVLEAGPTHDGLETCLLYTSPSPRDLSTSRMPSSA